MGVLMFDPTLDAIRRVVNTSIKDAIIMLNAFQPNRLPTSSASLSMWANVVPEALCGSLAGSTEARSLLATLEAQGLMPAIWSYGVSSAHVQSSTSASEDQTPVLGRLFQQGPR